MCKNWYPRRLHELYVESECLHVAWGECPTDDGTYEYTDRNVRMKKDGTWENFNPTPVILRLLYDN